MVTYFNSKLRDQKIRSWRFKLPHRQLLVVSSPSPTSPFPHPTSPPSTCLIITPNPHRMRKPLRSRRKVLLKSSMITIIVSPSRHCFALYTVLYRQILFLQIDNIHFRLDSQKRVGDFEGHHYRFRDRLNPPPKRYSRRV